MTGTGREARNPTGHDCGALKRNRVAEYLATIGCRLVCRSAGRSTSLISIGSNMLKRIPTQLAALVYLVSILTCAAA